MSDLYDFNVCMSFMYAPHCYWTSRLDKGSFHLKNLKQFEDEAVSRLSFYFYEKEEEDFKKYNNKKKFFPSVECGLDPYGNNNEINLWFNRIEKPEWNELQSTTVTGCPTIEIVVGNKPLLPKHNLDMKIFFQWPLIILFFCFHKKNINVCI
jgi:hypothetical protein